MPGNVPVPAPGAAHAIGMRMTRPNLWHAMQEFLTIPQPD